MLADSPVLDSTAYWSADVLCGCQEAPKTATALNDELPHVVLFTTNSRDAQSSQMHILFAI